MIRNTKYLKKNTKYLKRNTSEYNLEYNFLGFYSHGEANFKFVFRNFSLSLQANSQNTFSQKNRENSGIQLLKLLRELELFLYFLYSKMYSECILMYSYLYTLYSKISKRQLRVLFRLSIDTGEGWTND